MHYKHTQFGWAIIIPLLIFITIVFFALPPEAKKSAGTTILVVTFIVSILFYALTVEVDSETVKIAFGIGLIRKRFLLSDIESCRTVRNSWISGWGIRWIPGGWLYNVAGLNAVELKMHSGKLVRIGTDEPEALKQAIEAQLSQ